MPEEPDDLSGPGEESRRQLRTSARRQAGAEAWSAARIAFENKKARQRAARNARLAAAREPQQTASESQRARNARLAAVRKQRQTALDNKKTRPRAARNARLAAAREQQQTATDEQRLGEGSEQVSDVRQAGPVVAAATKQVADRVQAVVKEADAHVAETVNAGVAAATKQVADHLQDVVKEADAHVAETVNAGVAAATTEVNAEIARLAQERARFKDYVQKETTAAQEALRVQFEDKTRKLEEATAAKLSEIERRAQEQQSNTGPIAGRQPKEQDIVMADNDGQDGRPSTNELLAKIAQLEAMLSRVNLAGREPPGIGQEGPSSYRAGERPTPAFEQRSTERFGSADGPILCDKPVILAATGRRDDLENLGASRPRLSDSPKSGYVYVVPAGEDLTPFKDWLPHGVHHQIALAEAGEGRDRDGVLRIAAPRGLQVDRRVPGQPVLYNLDADIPLSVPFRAMNEVDRASVQFDGRSWTVLAGAPINANEKWYTDGFKEELTKAGLTEFLPPLDPARTYDSGRSTATPVPGSSYSRQSTPLRETSFASREQSGRGWRDDPSYSQSRYDGPASRLSSFARSSRQPTEPYRSVEDDRPPLRPAPVSTTREPARDFYRGRFQGHQR